jgi:hypothetical protein
LKTNTMQPLCQANEWSQGSELVKSHFFALAALRSGPQAGP